MGNNILMQSLLNAAIPTVEKLVGSGKIDIMLQDLKEHYRNLADLEDNESVEIILSTEADGCEYLNIVVIDAEMRIRNVMYQRKLQDAIIQLLKQSKNADRTSKQ